MPTHDEATHKLELHARECDRDRDSMRKDLDRIDRAITGDGTTVGFAELARTLNVNHANIQKNLDRIEGEMQWTRRVLLGAVIANVAKIAWDAVGGANAAKPSKQ